MTSIVQPTGSGKAAQDEFIGLERQITVDTDNNDLRLHDGVTPGGHPILRRDNADARYQARSEELDGFDFNPELRGFVSRQGAGLYRVRILKVNGGQLTIQNPDGYSGNPTISLNTRILTDHIFAGDIQIEGVLQVDGGINADTSGTHQGDVVGNVTGNVTGNLAGNANGNHTGSFTGDVDVRCPDLLLDDGQIATSKISGLAAFVKANAVPAGVILIWSGSIAAIPAGWALCNGLNGTPDLTEKFVIGAGSLDLDPGDFGGSLTHTHGNSINAAGAHTHDLTIADHALTVAELPSHNHGNGIGNSTASLFVYDTKPITPLEKSAADSANDSTVQGTTENTGSGTPHGHTGSTAASAGSHTHSMNNVAASSLPPYYALCYIMRVIV